MKELTFFRTYSYGGMEGKTVEKVTYETEELARESALKDTWNECFTLYKVTMKINGFVTEKEEKIGRIPCARDIKNIEYYEKWANKYLEEIEKVKASKSYRKEENRMKKIVELEALYLDNKEKANFYRKLTK